MIVFSLARGFNSIAAKDVLGKVIPKQQRGGISGLAASFAGFATLTFGLGLWYLQSLGYENGVYIALMLAVLMGLQRLATVVLKNTKAQQKALKTACYMLLKN